MGAVYVDLRRCAGINPRTHAESHGWHTDMADLERISQALQGLSNDIDQALHTDPLAANLSPGRPRAFPQRRARGGFGGRSAAGVSQNGGNVRIRGSSGRDREVPEQGRRTRRGGSWDAAVGLAHDPTYEELLELQVGLSVGGAWLARFSAGIAVVLSPHLPSAVSTKIVQVHANSSIKV